MKLRGNNKLKETPNTKKHVSGIFINQKLLSGRSNFNKLFLKNKHKQKSMSFNK